MAHYLLIDFKINRIIERKMNKKGGTLIELIVVMVIIAIGAVLAIPSVGPWLTNYRLKSATRDIASLMRTAQMKAVSTNMEHDVYFSDNYSYILRKNSGGWINEGVAKSLPSGITVSNITFSGRKVEFNPNSTASSGSVTLKVIGKETQKRIYVLAATGRIKIE